VTVIKHHGRNWYLHSQVRGTEIKQNLQTLLTRFAAIAMRNSSACNTIATVLRAGYCTLTVQLWLLSQTSFPFATANIQSDSAKNIKTRTREKKDD